MLWRDRERLGDTTNLQDWAVGVVQPAPDLSYWGMSRQNTHLKAGWLESNQTDSLRQTEHCCQPGGPQLSFSGQLQCLLNIWTIMEVETFLPGFPMWTFSYNEHCSAWTLRMETSCRFCGWTSKSYQRWTSYVWIFYQLDPWRNFDQMFTWYGFAMFGTCQ